MAIVTNYTVLREGLVRLAANVPEAHIGSTSVELKVDGLLPVDSSRIRRSYPAILTFRMNPSRSSKLTIAFRTDIGDTSTGNFDPEPLVNFRIDEVADTPSRGIQILIPTARFRDLRSIWIRLEGSGLVDFHDFVLWYHVEN
jgi:hypothetical protein